MSAQLTALQIATFWTLSQRKGKSRGPIPAKAEDTLTSKIIVTRPRFNGNLSGTLSHKVIATRRRSDRQIPASGEEMMEYGC